ncbi:hypothetical protein SESBI_19978 [Sesbania bispinosa]|nr:hypothetical protein SESBI_19978 [Sesbania bispinosa]
MGSARVSAISTDAIDPSADLSEQEKDLLDRSKKKPKVTRTGEPCTAKESDQGKPTPVNSHVEVPFQTTIGMGLERKMISYKDVCLGVNGHNTSEEDTLFFDVVDPGNGTEGGNALNDREHGFLGDPLCPVVRLTEVEREGIRMPWKRSIIVKLLGRRMSLKYFQARLYKLWQPRARMEIIDLDNEYFIIRFEDLDDLQHVFDDGPWIITDHYLVIQRWQPEFRPHDDDLKSVSVWGRR